MSDEDTYCGVEYGEAREGDCECTRCVAKPSEAEPEPSESEGYVEIGGQRMTVAQYDAARRPLLEGTASYAEADRLREPS